jgi:hypothetical protein
VIQASDFLSRYPEFASINSDPAVVTAMVENELDSADNMLSDTAFGKARNLAASLVVAHRLAVRFPSDDSVRNPNLPGVLAGQGASTGGANQQLAHSSMVTSASPIKADYSRTNYGLQYLSLIQRSVCPAQIVGRDQDDAGVSGEMIPWVFP